MGIFWSCLVIGVPEVSLLRKLICSAGFPELTCHSNLVSPSDLKRCANSTILKEPVQAFYFCRMIKMTLKKSLPQF